MQVIYALFTLSVLIEQMNCDPGVKPNFVHLTGVVFLIVMLKNMKKRLSIYKMKKKLVYGYKDERVSLFR